MTNKNIFVSIVVPVYNVETYLRECMDSIVNQTLKEIEIVCVNDGSTDSSLQILQEYERKDSRIKIIDKPNSGYGNTMNIGLQSAQGEYLGIVESDDYIEPDMFKRLYETAVLYEADVVKSDHYVFTTSKGNKKQIYQNICTPNFYNRILNAEVCEDIFDFSMMNWTGIYKRDFIESKHIMHNETPGASFQDNGFWFQVFCQAKKMLFINEAFYHYRQDNPNSSINNKNKVYTICEEYDYIQKFVVSNQKRGEDFYNIFWKKKVFNYLHTYKRLLEKYKIPFLKRIGEEFKEDLKSPYLCSECFDPWLVEQVNRIIDCPELYYLEDSRYMLNRKYEAIHELLLEIRRSKEFNKGLWIKKKLKL